MLSVLPIYYIAIAQAFFAALLLNRKNKKSHADKILIAWLIVIGIEMLYSLLNLTILPSLPDLIVIPFAYGPFLYFYTLTIISEKPFRIKKHYLHFIPFLVLFILGFVWKDSKSISGTYLFGQGLKTWLMIANYLLFIASMFGYWIVVFRKINVHQKKIANQFSFQNKSIRLEWLKNVAWWIMGSFILSGLCYVFFLIKEIYPFNPIAIYHAGLLMFVFSISYYGINQTSIRPTTKGHVSNSEYSAEEMSELEQQLESCMSDSKPYLNGELSLQELADELKVDVHKISHFLNHHLQKNFFTYINEYRTKEAQERISDPKNDRLTLLAIGYESGFNSKSSFNSLFKKFTGVTPSEFRKNSN